jgi:hypothetical protein
MACRTGLLSISDIKELQRQTADPQLIHIKGLEQIVKPSKEKGSELDLNERVPHLISEGAEVGLRCRRRRVGGSDVSLSTMARDFHWENMRPLIRLDFFGQRLADFSARLTNRDEPSAPALSPDSGTMTRAAAYAARQLVKAPSGGWRCDC